MAGRWEELSGYLGLPSAIIDRIRTDNPKNSISCWHQSVKEWINQNYDTERHGKPSWNTLVQAIGRVDNLACNKLAAKHQGICIDYSHSYCAGCNCFGALLPS